MNKHLYHLTKLLLLSVLMVGFSIEFCTAIVVLLTGVTHGRLSRKILI